MKPFQPELWDHAAGFLAPLVEQVEVGWPSDLLKAGIILVDLPGVGIYPGFPGGISGSGLLKALHTQAETYGVKMVRKRIDGLKRKAPGFLATFDGSQVKARFVLLATGIVDKSPQLPGLDEAIADGSIRYCPVCDGYEAADQRIGVLGHSSDASSKAAFLRTYSNDVTLLSLDDRATSAEKAQTLRKAGVKVAGPVSAIERSDTSIRAVLQDGQSLPFDVIYPALGCEVRSDLASSLGAKTNDVGCVEVDAHQRTTVDGIYAAGDVVSDLHQIAVGTGHAAIAATHIHKSLPENFKTRQEAFHHAEQFLQTPIYR